MAEHRKGSGRGGYFLTKPQVVLAASGFALTCLLAFLLASVSRQGTEEPNGLKQEEPMVNLPIQPPTASAKPGQGAPKNDQLTFYDALSKSPTAAPPAPD